MLNSTVFCLFLCLILLHVSDHVLVGHVMSTSTVADEFECHQKCLSRGGSRIFFRRGCTRLLLYFNTNKPHSSFFFCRIPVVFENRRSSQGGVRTPCTLPLDPPLLRNNSCKSFNVHPGADIAKRLCELNNKTRKMKPDDFIKKNGSSYYGQVKVRSIV